MKEYKFIKSYCEDDREINIYKYRNVEIYENFYGENEFLIGDEWYCSLEDAINDIDRDKRIESLLLSEKEYIKEFSNRPFCSIIEENCPFPSICINKCLDCELYKMTNKIKSIAKNDRKKYETLINGE